MNDACGTLKLFLKRYRGVSILNIVSQSLRFHKFIEKQSTSVYFHDKIILLHSFLFNVSLEFTEHYMVMQIIISKTCAYINRYSVR